MQKWNVKRHRRADRQAKKWKKVDMPMLTRVLKFEAELRNYGKPISQAFVKTAQKIKGGTNCFHCHLKAGNPTLVAVWTVDKSEKIILVSYYGTHEGAGEYGRYC